MDNTGSAGKKIVFKRRVLNAQQTLVESVALTGRESDSESVEGTEQSAFHYHGEIFDQFYRPLSVVGGEPRLAELAIEPLAPPAPPRRLAKHERADRDKELQEAGEALAHQVYALAQKARETDLDVYLSAFNVVLADRGCIDAKDILDKCNEFFTEQYYTPIRDRGERPEIYHQMLKRVGHEASERIGKIVKGLEIEATARRLWDLYHGSNADKVSRITDILLDCTEKQVRSVREEFLLIPYKDLARQLFGVLNKASIDQPQGAKRTIGKSEVYEQKKHGAHRSRDDLRCIKYLLLGRGADEMALIKRFYMDNVDADVSEAEYGLEADIKRRMLPSDTDKALPLLSGWSARREAEEIYKILYPHSLGQEVDDQLSDPKDSVDRDHTQGIGPLLRRFKKRRVWRNRNSVHHRVLNAYELVAERIAALSTNRFLKTNEILHEMYGFELDPTLFPSITLFDARRKATLIHDRLDASYDLLELLRPIEFLDPRQCLAVQKAYECVFGTSLRTVIEERLTALKISVTSKDVQESLERHLNGHGRWPLNVDLLARYRGEEAPPNVWEHDFRPAPEDEEAAIIIAGLVDQDSEDGDFDRKIHNFLWSRSYDDLNKLERAFFELTDPHVPMLTALQEVMSSDFLTFSMLLLGGVNVQETVQHLNEDASLLSRLRDLPSTDIMVLREHFKKLFFVDLVESVMERFQAPEQEDVLIENLAVLLTPEVHEFRIKLQSLKRDSSSEVEPMRKFWTGPLVKLMALERAYDLFFPRLRVHLKYAAARQALNSIVFAEIILCLEGVDPEVTSRLLENFDGVNIQGLQECLRENRNDQRIIEETYDLLYPDAPLRKSIKEMKVDLDLINETLLHLEGYFSRDVADEMEELIGTFEAESLGNAILELISIPTVVRPNYRIPEDINWMDEMVYQISLAYQRQYGAELLSVLRRKQVPELLREEITSRAFGHEVCTSAKDLYNLIKQNKEGQAGSEHAEERICNYLETRGVRHRDRLMRAYNAHWAHNPGFGSLLDDIAKFFRNSMVKKRMLTLLLGVNPERKTATPDPITVH